jgi:hypothetical protein
MTYRRHSGTNVRQIAEQTLTTTGKRRQAGSRFKHQDAFLTHGRREKVGVAINLLSGGLLGTMWDSTTSLIGWNRKENRRWYSKQPIMQVESVGFCHLHLHREYRPDHAAG